MNLSVLGSGQGLSVAYSQERTQAEVGALP